MFAPGKAGWPEVSQAKRLAGSHDWLWAGLLLMSGCATMGNLGDTLGTRVVGTGRTLVLSWDAHHPLARRLQSARIMGLRADYNMGGDPVSQQVAWGKHAGERRMSFTLPETLKAVPDDEICLYVEPGEGMRTLPVRSVAASKGETAGFRYRAWEAWVRGATRHKAAANRLGALRRNHKAVETQLAAVKRRLSERGWTHPGRCAQAVATGPGPERPFDVVEAEHHKRTAKQVCVRRALVFSKRVLNTPGLAKLVGGHAPAMSPARRKQVRMFLTDWKRWGAGVTRKTYRPETGTRRDSLPIVKTLYPLMKTLKSGRRLGRREMTAFTGGVLDAYHGCLEDVPKQLMTKLEAWERQRRQEPQRERDYRAYVTKQCKRVYADYEQLKAQAAEIRQQIDTQTTALQDVPAPLSTQTKDVLNFQSCTTLTGLMRDIRTTQSARLSVRAVRGGR